MPLSSNRTTFTFNHSDQVDEYGAAEGDYTAVQANFDSRAEENLADINAIKDVLRSTTDGDSGADNVKATPQAALGAADTIQGQLEAIVSLGSGTLPPDNSLTAAKIVNDTLTEAKMATDMKKDVVGGVTAYDTFTGHTGDSVTDVGGVHGLIITPGTWNPVIAGTTTPGTHTYAAQVGISYKIGDLMFISGRVQITTKDGTMAGNATITGLPESAVSDGGHGVSLAYYDNIDFQSVGSTQLTAGIVGNVIFLYENGDNKAVAAATAAAIKNGTEIRFSAFYKY